MRRRFLLVVAVVSLGACTGVGRLPVADVQVDDQEPREDLVVDVRGPEGGEESDSPEVLDVPLPSCEFETDGTLKYVTFDLTGTRCKFTLAEAAAGITFNYRIQVEKAVLNVVSYALDAGHCDEAGTSGLKVFEKIHGNGQSWCICDEGLCGPAGEPIEIAQGVYEDSFTWDGVNWNGPSDTNSPKGEPFPPGVYTLVLRVEGTYGAGEILFAETATMQIELVE
jgi:hypothetical protein